MISNGGDTQQNILPISPCQTGHGSGLQMWPHDQSLCCYDGCVGVRIVTVSLWATWSWTIWLSPVFADSLNPLCCGQHDEVSPGCGSWKLSMFRSQMMSRILIIQSFLSFSPIMIVTIIWFLSCHICMYTSFPLIPVCHNSWTWFQV